MSKRHTGTAEKIVRPAVADRPDNADQDVDDSTLARSTDDLAGKRPQPKPQQAPHDQARCSASSLLWPFATGRIRLPAGAKTLFLPQRPYVEHPFGTLKAWMDATHFLTGPSTRSELR